MAILAVLMEVIEVLQHRHIPEVYLWIILWLALAMVLLLTANALTAQPAIVVTEFGVADFTV